MAASINRLFCRLDGLTPAMREQQRVNILKNLGLLEAETIPVFDEATQTAARLLGTPICILGLMVNEQLWLKSAVGLSRLGLMNQIAASRKILREEAFCSYVVDSQQVLMIEDTFQDTVFAKSFLAQHYGIRAYLGAPLTVNGWCIGTLAVMDLLPRQFSPEDAELLSLCARWCLAEFERDHCHKLQSEQGNEWLIMQQPSPAAPPQESGDQAASKAHSLSTVKLRLIRGLTQQLRTPLTAVIGMASILGGEVFGALTQKQKEYVEIIRNSGQQINGLVDEIVKLGTEEEMAAPLQLNSVNVEMICQQVLRDVLPLARQKHQELRLSVEPGQRIWLLDKGKVQQALYYLLLSLLASSETNEGDVRIHVSRRRTTLNIALWISHPWLGDGLPQVKFNSAPWLDGLKVERELVSEDIPETHLDNQVLHPALIETALNELQDNSSESKPQALLTLLLSCYIAESHGGKILLQGSSDAGHRYVLLLPKIATQADS